MNLIEVVDHKDIYEDKEILDLMLKSMARGTVGRVQSAAEGIYSKQQGKFYKVEEDGKAIGILGLNRITKDRLELVHISVTDHNRKEEISKYMVDEVSRYHNAKEIRVETDFNTAQFYKKCGFKTKLTENELGLDEYVCTYIIN